MHFTWICYRAGEKGSIDLSNVASLNVVSYNQSNTGNKGCFRTGPGKLGPPYVQPLAYVYTGMVPTSTTIEIVLHVSSPIGSRTAQVTKTVLIEEAVPFFKIR